MDSFFIGLQNIGKLSFSYNTKTFVFTLSENCKIPIVHVENIDKPVDLHIGKSDSSFTVYESCIIKRRKGMKGFTDFTVKYDKIRSAHTADMRPYIIDEILSELL